VIVTVADADGASLQQTYELVVGSDTVNRRPQIESSPETFALAGEQYTY
jgi:hypothetical protein